MGGVHVRNREREREREINKGRRREDRRGGRVLAGFGCKERCRDFCRGNYVAS
jgi:hypothetical protein